MCVRSSKVAVTVSACVGAHQLSFHRFFLSVRLSTAASSDSSCASKHRQPLLQALHVSAVINIWFHSQNWKEKKKKKKEEEKKKKMQTKEKESVKLKFLEM